MTFKKADVGARSLGSVLLHSASEAPRVLLSRHLSIGIEIEGGHHLEIPLLAGRSRSRGRRSDLPDT